MSDVGHFAGHFHLTVPAYVLRALEKGGQHGSVHSRPKCPALSPVAGTRDRRDPKTNVAEPARQ